MVGSWRLAARFAQRELRGGLKGFRIFLACLALGVAAIAGVGSLAAGLAAGLAADGRALLGGDIELRLVHREANPDERAWLAARGRISETAQMRSMARDADGDARTLIELKAVDRAYPLYGAVALAPEMPLAAALESRDGLWGAAVEEGLLRRLGLELGDAIRVGEGRFELRATIVREPDRATEGLTLGPRVLVAAGGLSTTGLIVPGSLVHYHYRVALPPGTDAAVAAAAAAEQHKDTGWRVRDWRNGNPGLRQFIDRIGIFLVLIGLAALLVGGVGVANAVRSYLDGKVPVIATLKCLGASGSFVFKVYLIQVLLLAVGGIAVGLAAGAALPMGLAGLLGSVLPIPFRAGVYPWPLALAAGYGLLVGLAFALWPLARAREVMPAALFRDLVAPARRWPRPGYVVATIAAFVALAVIAIATTDERRFAVWFVVGAAGSFVAFGALAAAVAAITRRLQRPRLPYLRLALANLYRPGSATASVMLSLGLGLALLATVALIQGNLTAQVRERLPEQAPAFFFVDIQPDQVAEFGRIAEELPGVGAVKRVPSLRGRIVEVNGVPADQAPVTPEQRWVLRGDRGLTYSARLPENSRLVAGDWWPENYRGPPLVSLEAGAAHGLGLNLGDSITVNVLGRDIEARIASLRQVEWGSLDLNFVLVFSPGLLEAAPHTFIATVMAEASAEDPLLRAVTDRFPNITAIRIRDVLQQVNGLLEDIGRAVRAATGVTLLAGVLVLGGAIVAGHRRRVREAVLLKVLGATRLDVLKAYIVEYALIGGVTAVLAAAIGWGAAWLVLTQVMGTAWIALPATLVGTVAVGVLLTLAVGLAGTWRALSQRPAPVLRQL